MKKSDIYVQKSNKNRKKNKIGKIEKEAKEIRRRTNIQKVILRTIATAGFLSVALLAPNALQVLTQIDKMTGVRRKMNPKYLIGSAFEKVIAKGYVCLEEGENGKVARLTNEGRRALGRMIANSPDTRKHKRWDKRWRMVIYDIKENRRGVRVALQRTLRVFGFYQLQASVWVYPYDCEALLILLKADFKIGRDVLYGVVEKVEGDDQLKNYFGLK